MHIGLKRKLYCLLACCSLALGTIGLVVPLLPTTVFVLFAAWAAAKGSPRFHAWLLNHPWFGATIQRWQRDRSVSLTVKKRALLSMLVSGLIIWVFVPPLWLKLLATAGLLIGMLCVWRLRTSEVFEKPAQNQVQRASEVAAECPGKFKQSADKV